MGGKVIGTGFERGGKFLPCLVLVVQAKLSKPGQVVGVGDLGPLAGRHVGLAVQLRHTVTAFAPASASRWKIALARSPSPNFSSANA